MNFYLRNLLIVPKVCELHLELKYVATYQGISNCNINKFIYKI